MKDKLLELGIEEDKVQVITQLVDKEVNNKISEGYIPKYRFDEVSEQKKALSEQVAERDTKIASLLTSQGATEELKKQVAQMQEELEQKDIEAKTKFEEFQKQSLARQMMEQGDYVPHCTEDMLKFIDFDKLTVIDGKLIGFEEQKNNLVKTKGYAFQEAGITPKGKEISQGLPDNSQGATNEVGSDDIANMILQYKGEQNKGLSLDDFI